MEYANLEVSELRALYLKTSNDLSSGKDWLELKEQRDRVTGLAIVLHRRLTEIGRVTPADFQIRNSTEEAI